MLFAEQLAPARQSRIINPLYLYHHLIHGRCPRWNAAENRWMLEMRRGYQDRTPGGWRDWTETPLKKNQKTYSGNTRKNPSSVIPNQISACYSSQLTDPQKEYRYTGELQVTKAVGGAWAQEIENTERWTFMNNHTIQKSPGSQVRRLHNQICAT